MWVTTVKAMNELHDFMSQVRRNSLKKDKGQLATIPRNSDCGSKFDNRENLLQASFLFVHCIVVCCRCKKDQT